MVKTPLRVTAGPMTHTLFEQQASIARHRHTQAAQRSCRTLVTTLFSQPPCLSWMGKKCQKLNIETREHFKTKSCLQLFVCGSALRAEQTEQGSSLKQNPLFNLCYFDLLYVLKKTCLGQASSFWWLCHVWMARPTTTPDVTTWQTTTQTAMRVSVTQSQLGPHKINHLLT